MFNWVSKVYDPDSNDCISVAVQSTWDSASMVIDIDNAWYVAHDISIDECISRLDTMCAGLEWVQELRSSLLLLSITDGR